MMSPDFVTGKPIGNSRHITGAAWKVVTQYTQKWKYAGDVTRGRNVSPATIFVRG